MQLVQQTNVYNCVLHSVYPSIRLSVYPWVHRGSTCGVVSDVSRQTASALYAKTHTHSLPTSRLSIEREKRQTQNAKRKTNALLDVVFGRLNRQKRERCERVQHARRWVLKIWLKFMIRDS